MPRVFTRSAQRPLPHSTADTQIPCAYRTVTPRQANSPAEAISNVLVRGLGTTDFSFERTSEGLSTEVYLVESRGARYYLRIAEEVGGDLASEIEIHKRLRDLGVRAPDVTYYEAFAPELERSISITTEIAGRSLMFCEDESAARQAVSEAGRDLARINQISVNGYGWIRDGRPGPWRRSLPRGSSGSILGWTMSTH